MFDTADILVDRHPVGRGLTRKALRMVWIGKAQEIPRALEKRIERILLTDGLAPAFRTWHMLPGRMVGQWIAGSFEIDILGKLDRQIGFRNRHKATGIAVNDRDRATPIALTRHSPVTKPVGCFPSACLHGLQRVDCGTLSVIDTHPVPWTGIKQAAWACIGGIGNRKFRRTGVLGQHDGNHTKIVGVREIQVALVMGRTAENCAGAIFHQHKIGDVDRQPAVGNQRVLRCQTGIESPFLGRFDGSFRRA